MKLTDLDPVWVLRDGKRVGFTFINPREAYKPALGHIACRQSCFLESPPNKEQWLLFAKTHGPDPEDYEWPRDLIHGCTPGTHWKITSGPIDKFRPEDIETADFATLTVTPSIDGSAGGNWHGFITNGEIVGGL